MKEFKLIKNRMFLKIVAIVVIQAFLLQNIAWGAMDARDLSYKAQEQEQTQITPLNIDTFTIPENMGEIKDSFKGTSDKVVFHIQDAHCNYAAQNTIAEIIEYLNKKYGVNTVNLEGGEGTYDLSIFTDIKDKEIRRKVADYFVQKGVINGAENFAINKPKEINLWGVENTKLYLKNLNVYRNSLEYKDEINKSLGKLNRILNTLKLRMFSKDLLELDKKYAQYKTGNINFKKYITYLINTADSMQVDLRSFPYINVLKQTWEKEETINFKKANIQRDKLIDRLQRVLSEEELVELVSKTVKSKEKEISQEAFYSYLIRKAKSTRLDLKKFPELKKYISYVSLYNTLDKSEVMKEVNTLEARIKETLYENDKQEKLSLLSKNLILMKNLFNIKLTKNDYEYYKSNKKSFSVENYISFISAESPLYNISADLDENIYKLDKYRKQITKFYEYSFKRDRVFLKNLKFPNKRSKILDLRPTIFITGGFHNENLGELFKKNNISYISIMPKFENKEGYKNTYFNLLEGRDVGLSKYIKAETSLLAVFSYLNEHRDRVYGGGVQNFEDEVQAVRELYSGERPEAVISENLSFVVGNKTELERSLEDGRVIEEVPGVSLVDGKKVFAVWSGQTDEKLESEIKGGGWFRNATYMKWFAWWVEPAISFTLARGVWLFLMFYDKGGWGSFSNWISFLDTAYF